MLFVRTRYMPCKHTEKLEPDRAQGPRNPRRTDAPPEAANQILIRSAPVTDGAAIGWASETITAVRCVPPPVIYCPTLQRLMVYNTRSFILLSCHLLTKS